MSTTDTTLTLVSSVRTACAPSHRRRRHTSAISSGGDLFLSAATNEMAHLQIAAMASPVQRRYKFCIIRTKRRTTMLRRHTTGGSPASPSLSRVAATLLIRNPPFAVGLRTTVGVRGSLVCCFSPLLLHFSCRMHSSEASMSPQVAHRSSHGPEPLGRQPCIVLVLQFAAFSSCRPSLLTSCKAPPALLHDLSGDSSLVDPTP